MRYCVYALFREERPFQIVLPFYIGSGSVARAYTSASDRMASRIQIVFTETRDAAYALEAEMILLYRPEQNYVVPATNGKPGRWIKQPRRERRYLERLTPKEKANEGREKKEWENTSKQNDPDRFLTAIKKLPRCNCCKREFATFHIKSKNVFLCDHCFDLVHPSDPIKRDPVKLNTPATLQSPGRKLSLADPS